MKRLRILFVTHCRPVLSSGIVPVPFAYHVPRHLSLMHEVHLAWLDQAEAGETEFSPAGGDDDCKFSSLQPIKVKRRRRDFLGYLSAIPNRYPYVFVEMARSIRGQVSSAIKKLISAHNPHIVHASGATLALPLAQMRGIPKVLAPLDCLWAVQRSIARSSTNPFVSAHHFMYSLKMKKYEADFYPAFDSVIFLSQRDATLAKQANPRIKAEVIPLGVDTDLFTPAPKKERELSLVFHGSMSHPPNREAAQLLVENVFPIVRQRVRDASLTLIGKGQWPDRLIRASGTKGLHILGSVQDLPACLARCSVYLSPLFSGGGMKNKILEAMACGLPVVGSPESFTGIRVIDGVHCVVATGLNEFLEASVRLLSDATEREEIGKAARKLVVSNHSWKETARQCSALYNRLVGF